jgi:ATP-dependent Clp protease ATP-binding subunit ClpB
MDLSKLTLKSQTALEGAIEEAQRRNQQAVEPEHVLVALLSDPEGVIYPLLHHLGASPRTLRDQGADAVDKLPKVYAQGTAAEARLSPQTSQMLERAYAIASELTDEYISTEHLLLAMLDGSGAAASVLAEAGLTRDSVLGALAEVRGRQRVTDQNPEDKYQALEKYGRDLTELAREGKEVERAPRPVRIDRYELESWDGEWRLDEERAPASADAQGGAAEIDPASDAGAAVDPAAALSASSSR